MGITIVIYIFQLYKVIWLTLQLSTAHTAIPTALKLFSKNAVVVLSVATSLYSAGQKVSSQTIEQACGDQIQNGYIAHCHPKDISGAFLCRMIPKRKQLIKYTAVPARCIRKCRVQLLKAEVVARNGHVW